MSALSHSEIEELLGAYALDAVEADEALEIEAHLATCPRCRAELFEHREVAGLFAYAGQRAPEGLWDRITAGLQETPPELQLERIRPAMVTPETLGELPPAAIIPLDRARRRTLGTRAFLALASAAAVIVAVLGVALVHTSQRADRPSAAATMTDVRRALEQKGSRKVILAAPRGSASLDAVVTPSGVSYLYDANLTPLSGNRTYQVWGVVGSQRISYGLLGSDPPAVVRFDAGPGLQGLAVTDEVASGVVVSHEPAVVAGTVSPPL